MNNKIYLKRYSRRVKLVLFSRNIKGQSTAYLVKRNESTDSESGKWRGLCLATLGGKPHKGEDDLAALARILHETSDGRLNRLSILALLNTLDDGSNDGGILHIGEHATIYGLVVPDVILGIIYPDLDRSTVVHITVKNLPQLVRANDTDRFTPPADGKIVVFAHLESALKVGLRGRTQQLVHH